MTKRLAFVLLFLSSAASAAPSLPQLPMSHSADSRDLYGELRGYRWDCPKDDEATKAALVAHAVQVAAAISDEYDRGQFTTYATDLQAWFDTYRAGVPGAGTWAELERAYKKARAAFDAMPADAPTGAANVKAALDIYATVRVQAKAVAALEPKLRESPCSDHPGNWYQLSNDGAAAAQRADNQLHVAVDPVVEAYNKWLGTRAVLDEPVATTYWEHVKQTALLVDLAAATEALAPQLADLAAWRPALTGDAATIADAAATELATTLDTARARADQQLAEIAMPPLKQDKARAKLVKKMLAGVDGGVQVGIVVGPKGTGKDSWTEDVEVGRDSSYAYYKTYKFVREYYSTYYAWKPSGSTGDVCELWHQSFYRYKKGSPGVEKSWTTYQSWKEGYVSCKLAKTVSKKKVKKG